MAIPICLQVLGLKAVFTECHRNCWHKKEMEFLAFKDKVQTDYRLGQGK